MEDLSHLGEHIFWDAAPKADLYLEGHVSNKHYDFGPNFNGNICVVPLSVYKFATREIYNSNWEEKKDVLDKWIENGGIENIDRFLSQRDLTTALGKGTHVRLLVDFPNNSKWREENSFYLPADSITAIKIMD